MIKRESKYFTNVTKDTKEEKMSNNYYSCFEHPIHQRILKKNYLGFHINIKL